MRHRQHFSRELSVLRIIFFIRKRKRSPKNLHFDIYSCFFLPWNTRMYFSKTWKVWMCKCKWGKDFQLKSLKFGTTLYIVQESYGLCLLFLMSFHQFWSPVWFYYAKEQLEHIHCKISPFVLHGIKIKWLNGSFLFELFLEVILTQAKDLCHTCFSAHEASLLSFFLSLPRSCSSHWVVRFCIMQSTSNFTAAFAPTTLKCRRFWNEVRHCTLSLHIWEQENRIDYFY